VKKIILIIWKEFKNTPTNDMLAGVYIDLPHIMILMHKFIITHQALV